MGEKSNKPPLEQITDKMEELEVDEEQSMICVFIRISEAIISIF
jgi:hypothetical protein